MVAIFGFVQVKNGFQTDYPKTRNFPYKFGIMMKIHQRKTEK